MVAQRGGTGGNNRFATEGVRWQPGSGAASYAMPSCPVRPPGARFDPAGPQHAQAWWTVRTVLVPFASPPREAAAFSCGVPFGPCFASGGMH